MSFWKKLFGIEKGEAERAADPVEYKGFTIHPRPYRENGQYQTAGLIEKEIGSLRKEHRFIRADRFAGFDDAVAFTVMKARQIIDQEGEAILR